MPDDSNKPAPLSLHVIPTNRKLDEFRREFAEHPPEPKVVDRQVDLNKSPAQNAIELKVIETLKTVFDPEIPVSIWDLGLIYSIDVTLENAVKVTMTLTAPACPVAGMIVAEVQRKVAAIEGVSRADIDLVWDPPWTKDRMSEAAFLELGLA
jgi:FeS assembly SUF system protein